MISSVSPAATGSLDRRVSSTMRRSFSGLSSSAIISTSPRGVINALAVRSARRMTPPIISFSSASSTPALSASAMMVRTSSSLTPSLVRPLLPIIRSTALPDASSSQTSGDATFDRSIIAGATRQAIRSGSPSANCFGTSSPMISDR